jgi:hypothetical protein
VPIDRPTESTGPPCRRALCGWSPAALTADTPAKGFADRVLTSAWSWVAAVVAITALFNLAPHLSTRAGLAVDGGAMLLGGTLCSANFWRCRHAHCLITGPGWLALAAFVFVEAGIGHSLIRGWEQPAFLAMLALSLLFEWTWSARRGSNAIVRTR